MWTKHSNPGAGTPILLLQIRSKAVTVHYWMNVFIYTKPLCQLQFFTAHTVQHVTAEKCESLLCLKK